MGVLRKVFASFLIAAVALTIGMLFWQMELKYTQPTPVPENYQEVYVNTKVYIGDTANTGLTKPVFYHFFSTECACSRFNLDHFNLLKKNFSNEVDFYVVIPADEDISEARPYFEGETRIIQDQNKEFALATGVYATPQAVIINTQNQLYFRGNYNRARYCTDPFSNYAQMALDSLIALKPAPEFGPMSYISYGCGIN